MAKAYHARKDFDTASTFRTVADEIDNLRAELAALKMTLQNIEIHFDQLCSDDLRRHGFIAHDHSIDFQVFRVLCGYAEALQEIAALKDAVRPVVNKGVCDQTGQHVTVFCNVDEWAALAALVGEE